VLANIIVCFGLFIYAGFVMAARRPTRLPVEKSWESHGWWIKETATGTPSLYVTESVLETGKTCSALGRAMGDITAVTSNPGYSLYMTCKDVNNDNVTKFALHRKLLMAPVPEEIIQNPMGIKWLPIIDRAWRDMAEQVRKVRHDLVSRCASLTQEEVILLRRMYQDHKEYEDYIQKNPENTNNVRRPFVPLELQHIYDMLAHPTQMDWVQHEIPQSNREATPSESVDFDATSAPPLPVDSTQEVSDMQRVQRSGRGTGRTSNRGRNSRGGATIADRGQSRPNRARGDRSMSRRGRDLSAGAGGSTLNQRGRGRTTSGHARGNTTTTARGRPRPVDSSTAPSSSRGPTVDEEELRGFHSDSDDDSEGFDIIDDDSETEKAPVPTDAEILAGSLWGDIIFSVPLAHVQDVQHPETNHRVLSDLRMLEMYDRLKGPLQSSISKLVLRPIRWIKNETLPDGSIRKVEVSFPKTGARKEFQTMFNAFAQLVEDNLELSKRMWLENHIIWEPVDGQHVVAACKLAKRKLDAGELNLYMFEKYYYVREATFVVYDNWTYYIDKSMRVNNAEWERKRYTVVSEDLQKLRHIWEICGKPDASRPEDDKKRAKALVMAANALHRLHILRDNKGSSKALTMKDLWKDLRDIVRHAWFPNEALYNGILGLCQDYDKGYLFLTENSEKQWLAMAERDGLNPNVDTRVKRPELTHTTLRPLNTLRDEDYLFLVQRCRAREVVDGVRLPQRYYFGRPSKTSIVKTDTMIAAADALQREQAVRNALRWLHVSARRVAPESMEAFFRLPVSQFFSDGGEQLKFFAKNIDKAMNKAWAAPKHKRPGQLADIASKISPVIIQHYQSITSGGSGYHGYRREVTDLRTASWEWQVTVPHVGDGVHEGRLPIRCRSSFFRGAIVELGEPCTWIFDCRRVASTGIGNAWRPMDYENAMLRLERWMDGIERWNIIFLLPPGEHMKEKVRESIQAQSTLHCFSGMWGFDRQHIKTYKGDYKEGSTMVQQWEAPGEVFIVLRYPEGAAQAPSYVVKDEPLPLLFQDVWRASMKPSENDPLERCPSEVQRLVSRYLPTNWGLVLCGMATAGLPIIQESFTGSQLIVIDDSPERTGALHRALSDKYEDDMLPVVRESIVDDESSSSDHETSSDSNTEDGEEEEGEDHDIGAMTNMRQSPASEVHIEGAAREHGPSLPQIDHNTHEIMEEPRVSSGADDIFHSTQHAPTRDVTTGGQINMGIVNMVVANVHVEQIQTMQCIEDVAVEITSSDLIPLVQIQEDAIMAPTAEDAMPPIESHEDITAGVIDGVGVARASSICATTIQELVPSIVDSGPRFPIIANVNTDLEQCELIQEQQLEKRGWDIEEPEVEGGTMNLESGEGNESDDLGFEDIFSEKQAFTYDKDEDCYYGTDKKRYKRIGESSIGNAFVEAPTVRETGESRASEDLATKTNICTEPTNSMLEEGENILVAAHARGPDPFDAACEALPDLVYKRRKT
jgi:hypothetical protein